MLTTSQILNLTVLTAQTSPMFGFCQEMTSSLGNVNKPSGSQFSIIFLTFADFKNQSRYASGFFYDVKGTWWAIYLKSTKPLPIIFKSAEPQPQLHDAMCGVNVTGGWPVNSEDDAVDRH